MRMNVALIHNPYSSGNDLDAVKTTVRSQLFSQYSISEFNISIKYLFFIKKSNKGKIYKGKWLCYTFNAHGFPDSTGEPCQPPEKRRFKNLNKRKRCTMPDELRSTTKHDAGQSPPRDLTRRQLRDLEEKEKTPLQKALELLIMVLPLFCGGAAALEYWLVPNSSANREPMSYLAVLLFFIFAYFCWLCFALFQRRRGEKSWYEKLRYRAPLFSGLFLLLMVYDVLTLKTGILTQPFVPCMNLIINAFLTEYKMLFDCTLNTLRLLFLGYGIGVALGLVTGITCGYSKRVRYWIDPVIKFLGPIPTTTWIPITMVIAPSLFGGAVFIIALGSWFAVTVASLTGISNVDKDFFEAARTLGASKRQLVFRVAIPYAMPSILQGCTQAMSSACVAIIIAEMLGVKSGLGWYMTWQTGWASYDKMFAALFVICLIFTLVTKALEAVKRRVLRWQIGDEK